MIFLLETKGKVFSEYEDQRIYSKVVHASSVTNARALAADDARASGMVPFDNPKVWLSSGKSKCTKIGRHSDFGVIACEGV